MHCVTSTFFLSDVFCALWICPNLPIAGTKTRIDDNVLDPGAQPVRAVAQTVAHANVGMHYCQGIQFNFGIDLEKLRFS